MTGETISRYVIREKLGEGGTAVVYKAIDTKLDRAVALKFPAPRLLRTDEARRRFEPEAKTAAALNHPRTARSLPRGGRPRRERRLGSGNRKFDFVGAIFCLRWRISHRPTEI